MNKTVLIVGGVLCLVGSALGLGATAWADQPAPAEPKQTEPSTPAADKPAGGQPAEKPADKAPGADKPSHEEEAKLVYVSMKTSKGEIVLQLNAEKAPITVKNFLHYTEEGFYDGTIFHRVIPNFMIQGGGFTKDMSQKQPTAKPIKNEWKNGLKNERGTVAMARLGNQPDSASCQFFINVKDNPFLDQPNDGAGYAVFGKVVEGMDVVDAIKAVPTASHGPHGDVPKEPVVIESVTKLSDDEAKKYAEKK